VPDADFVKSIGGRILTLGAIEDAMKYITGAIECVSARLRSPSVDRSAATDDSPLGAYLDGKLQDSIFYQRRVAQLKARTRELFDVLSYRVNVNQADSVNQLTMLAAIFLPLSLAAGVLSMQTRFSELNFLLYDFVGVVLILGTMATLLAIITRYGPDIYDDILLYSYSWRLYVAPKLRKCLKFTLLTVWWLALLASFLVGMLKDSIFGLRLFGFEAAGITGLWLLSLKGVRMGYDYHTERKERKERKQRV
jgi:hypothetical protein